MSSRKRNIRLGCIMIIGTLIVFAFVLPRLPCYLHIYQPKEFMPMVFINNRTYAFKEYHIEWSEIKDEVIYLGQIESYVGEKRYPKENFQANKDIIGASVYQYRENIIITDENDICLFVPITSGVPCPDFFFR